MKDFKNKVAVVTGAASGIGRGLAEQCVKEGMKVVLADIETSALAEVENEFRSKGAEVLAIATDVSKDHDVERLSQKTVDVYGAVHLLFNNAGVMGDTWIWKNTLADWEWILGVNLWGVIHGIRIFVPIMLAQESDCHIINTASIAGLLPLAGFGAYSVTKHGVVTMSEVLHHELELMEARVKVSVLCLGPVSTQIGRAERNRPTPKSHRDGGKGPLDNETAQRFFKRLGEDTLQPSQVAELAFEAIREEAFHILTHSDYNRARQLHLDDYLQGRNPRSAVSLLAP
jgi:NAD(P)-dependent dehydrogenase (short-subunit alcohol dehydrogenase family)